MEESINKERFSDIKTNKKEQHLTKETTMAHEIITNIEAINEVLDRGTIVDVLPSIKEFREALQSGERLRFYIGFDATAPTLHLSHAKNLQLMEKFRKLGHEVIVLFGDFTARIGDPSDRASARQPLTAEQVMDNVERWKELINPLMDFSAEENPPKIKFNSEWLKDMKFEDVLKLASTMSVQQLLERSMFQKRIESEKPIFVHEFLYPLMQGFDSVAMDVDVEICGTDQTFNALVGRNFQKRFNHKEKFVVCVTLMEDPKTGSLMSKSLGNGVFLDAKPNDMFGQIMSQTDEMIRILFVNCVPSLSIEEIDDIMNDGPLSAKLRLAEEVVKIYHGADSAKTARENFKQTIQDKEAPEDIKIVRVSSASDKGPTLQEIVLAGGFEGSKSQIRRLAEQGGIKVDDRTINNQHEIINIPPDGVVIKVGKRMWFKATT